MTSPTPGEICLARDIAGICQATQPLDIPKLRRLFLLMTQAHFSSAAHYGAYQEDLCGFTYDATDPEKSRLLVALADTFNALADNVRPAVYVKLDGFVLAKTVLNDDAGLNEVGDRQTYTQQAKGQLVVTGVHASFDIASRLAETAYDMLQGLRESIMETMGLLSFEGVSILKAEPKGRRPEKFYQMETTFQLTFPLNVNRVSEDHLLKKVALYASFSD